MHTAEQVAQMVIEHAREITKVQESAKSAHRRIDENDRMIAGIHELAKNIAEITAEIKQLTKRLDGTIERIEGGQKAQGERIGNIEKTIMLFERNEKNIEEHEKRLDAIEKAPGHKWDKLGWIVIGGIVTAVVAFIMARIL